jgi:hypothetical protein
LCSMLPVCCVGFSLCVVFDVSCVLCSMLPVSPSCLFLIVRFVCLRPVCCDNLETQVASNTTHR